MSRQNNNSPVPQDVIQNIDIVNNNNEVANHGNGGETDSHADNAE